MLKICCIWTVTVGRGMFTWVGPQTQWVLRTDQEARKKFDTVRTGKGENASNRRHFYLPHYTLLSTFVPPPSPLVCRLSWLDCDFPTTFMYRNLGARSLPQNNRDYCDGTFFMCFSVFPSLFAGDQVVAINNSIAALSKNAKDQQQHTGCLIEPTDQVQNNQSWILWPYSAFSSKDSASVEGMNEFEIITLWPINYHALEF